MPELAKKYTVASVDVRGMGNFGKPLDGHDRAYTGLGPREMLVACFGGSLSPPIGTDDHGL